MLESTVYVVVAVAIFAVVSFTFLFPCNTLIPLDRRTVAVVGSILCYLSRRYAFPSSNMNLIDAIDFDVLILLSSIMVVNHLVIHLKETKKVITYLQQLVQSNPEKGFWMVSLAAFLLSPFLTNDGVCLLFVEPILLAFEATIALEEDVLTGNNSNTVSNSPSKLHSSDAMYFLLALACSSNIGSALTYTGNPQNMIVGTASVDVMPPYKFFLYMLVPSVLSWLATQWYIQRCWRSSKAQYQPVNVIEPEFSAELNTTSASSKVLSFPRLNIPWCGCSNPESTLLTQCYSPRSSLASTSNRAVSGLLSPTTPRRRRARQRADVIQRVVRIVVSPFPYMVLILVATMIVMIFVNIMPISGLICVSSVVMVVSVVMGNHWRNQKVWDAESTTEGSAESNDAASGRHRRKRSRARSTHLTTELIAAQLHTIQGDVECNAESKENSALISESNASMIEKADSAVVTSQDGATKHPAQAEKGEGVSSVDRLDNLNEFFEGLFNSIDYSLLVIFMGTFIVVANMESTGIPKAIWNLLVGKKPFETATSIIGVSSFVLLTSQLLGNVAVIQLAKPNVMDLTDDYKRIAWAVLSFVATIGGNLTITGSAANIIVVEKAARLDPNMSIDFFQHFRVCFWVTLACCAVGGSLVFLIVQFDNVIGQK